MRKMLCGILIVALFLLTACDTEVNIAATTASAAPPLEEPVVLTVCVPYNAQVEDYETNAYTLWLEEQTGYELEFMVWQPLGDHQVDPFLMAENLPDIFWGFHILPEKWAEYGAAGVLMDLAPYYNDRGRKASAFWQRISQLPQETRNDILASLSASDGGRYVFPDINYSQVETMAHQVFINREWLEKLKLEMPNSPESLHSVLEAFRDGDPNGNGRKDEIPLIASAAQGGDAVQWIINMFTACNDDRWFHLDESGELYLPHRTDDYRRALVYIHGLMEDGLMYPSAISLSEEDMQAYLNAEEGEPITVGVWAGDPETVWEMGNRAIYCYEALPYWGSVVRSEPVVLTNGAYITGSCQAPDAAWDLLMTMCSEEGSLRMRYGVEGEDWVKTDAVSCIGTRTKVKVLDSDAFFQPGNATWGAACGSILIDEALPLQYEENRDPWEEYQIGLMTASYFHFIRAESEHEGAAAPRLSIPGDAGEKCQWLISTAREGFCTGTGEFNDPEDDGQWADFLTSLDERGYDAWLEEYRQAYANSQ